MSERARAYILEWVRDNPMDVTDGGAAAAEALARDARRLGIASAEFEEAVGDVPRFLAQEVARRSSPDGREQLERGASDA